MINRTGRAKSRRNWPDLDPLAIFYTMAGVLALVLIAVVVITMINTPDTGKIYDKEYSAGYTTIESDCVTYNNKGICTFRMSRSVYHPEHWYLCLDNRQQDKKGCKAVDQVDYHKYEIGQWYP